MKTAQQSVQKYVERAGAAVGDYVSGAANTTKDQAQRAIAAKAIYQAELTASFARDSYAKGLAKSGKAGWNAGVAGKGAERFGPGVAHAGPKYGTESAKFDGARGASEGMPTGLKGSATNLAKVAKVVAALIAVKRA